MTHVFEFFYQMGDTIDSEAMMRIRIEEELLPNSWYQKYCREKMEMYTLNNSGMTKIALRFYCARDTNKKK